ncbi:MAG: hypothetical protein FWD31_14420, partial [Planctomycetaceae bacterium]|nr:hypothetical protein [Planctomycetaceae bacterium]
MIGCKRIRVVFGESLRIDGLILHPAALFLLGHDSRHFLLNGRSPCRFLVVRRILRNPGSLLHVVGIGTAGVNKTGLQCHPLRGLVILHLLIDLRTYECEILPIPYK